MGVRIAYACMKPQVFWTQTVISDTLGRSDAPKPDIASEAGIPGDPECAFTAIETRQKSAVLVETACNIEIEIGGIKVSADEELVGKTDSAYAVSTPGLRN